MARPRANATTPQFSFRLDPSLRSDLELLAREDDRTLGYYIERVLRKHRDENVALVNDLRKRAGLAAVLGPAVGAYQPNRDKEMLAAEPAASYTAQVTPQHSHSSDLAAKEQRRIDRMLAKEQRKKDSAVRGAKRAAPGKSAAKTGE